MFKKNTGGMSERLQNRPDLNALHQLLSQGLERRGKQLSLSWRTGGQSFTLFLICNVRGDPRWCLYSDEGNRQLVFDYNSCDPLLVFNLISSSTTKFQQKTRSPFLGSLASRSKKAEPQQDFLAAMAGSNQSFSQGHDWQPPGYQTGAVHDSGQPDAETTDYYVVEAEQQADALAWPIEPQSVENAWGDSPDLPGWTAEQSADSSSETKVETEGDGKTAPAVAKTLKLKPRPIDGAVIQSVMMKLRRPDTGMFLYPAFLYFLEEEFFRNYRSKASLSVIIFDLKSVLVDGGEGAQALPTVAIVDAVLRISELKRNVDLLADYDKGMYALILPNTKAAGTKIFANRVIRAVTDVPLQGLAPKHKLSLAFGAASIPEDFGDLGRLLGGAELALGQARTTRQALVMYHEIKEMVDLPSDA